MKINSNVRLHSKRIKNKNDELKFCIFVQQSNFKSFTDSTANSELIALT